MKSGTRVKASGLMTLPLWSLIKPSLGLTLPLPISLKKARIMLETATVGSPAGATKVSVPQMC